MKKLLITLVILVILGAVGWAYWYFMMGPQVTQVIVEPDDPSRPGFQPLNPNSRPTVSPTSAPSAAPTAIPTNQTMSVGGSLPVLRLLSDTPVGGYGASTTATTTKVRWVDRGRGNVYEASYDSAQIATISNTVVPRIFRSIWNRDLTSFTASLYEDSSLVPTTVSTDILKSSKNGTSSAALAPFELKGKTLTGNIIDYAVSPDRNRMITIMNENGSGVGYISGLNAANPTRIFTTPLTDITVAWPADNVIAVTTKASASYAGYLYFVNVKTGVWTKVLGPIYGLTTKVNSNAKYVLYSMTGRNKDVSTHIYSVSSATSTDAVIRTISDKCAWGNVVREKVYCGVPSQLPAGTYPDGWHMGTISMTDKMWEINAATGEIKIISTLIDQADRILNVTEVGLDPRDKQIFFMNKNDLSLWSLDLSRTR